MHGDTVVYAEDLLPMNNFSEDKHRGIYRVNIHLTGMHKGKHELSLLNIHSKSYKFSLYIYLYILCIYTYIKLKYIRFSREVCFCVTILTEIMAKSYWQDYVYTH